MPPILLTDATFSVRSATAIQLTSSLMAQRSARLSFVACALTEPPLASPSPESVSAATAALHTSMASLWRIKCDNRYKDTFWRFTVNGLRSAGGHDIAFPCSCGWRPPALASVQSKALAMRAHCFWECPVADAVVSEIRRALPPSTPISKSNLWLLHPPAVPGLHPEAWAVVAMMAIHAVSRGRGSMWSASLRSSPPPPPTDLVRAGTRAAQGWFWCLLQDYVNLQSLPPSWASLGPHHPFLHVIPTPNLPGAVDNAPKFTLRLTLPTSLTLPITLDD
jgi:hypothetical protein